MFFGIPYSLVEFLLLCLVTFLVADFLSRRYLE
jgi:hypothetical protein